MPSASTIFWIEVTDDEATILDRVAQAKHARLVEAKMYSLAPLTLAATAQGAVVFVARTQQEATRALGMGVDEVIRAGEITEENLAATLERADARAEARASHELRRDGFREQKALAALVAAFGRRLEQPLLSAALAQQVLDSALPIVFDVDDRFVEWTVRAAPIEEVRELAIRRLAIVPSSKLIQLVEKVRDGLERAFVLASALTRLSAGSSTSKVAVGHLVRDIVDVMRPEIAATATIKALVDGACDVTLEPGTVAFILSALIDSAAEAVRKSQYDGGRIEIRLSEQEDVVVLEVWDNGRRRSADLRPTMFDAYFDPTHPSRGALADLRERLRTCGGELTIDSGEGGTTVRALLPTSSEDVLFTDKAEPSKVVVKKRPG